MTDVEFFFDPSCPWTWVTSRWLTTVAPERDLTVTWRTWSLAINSEGRELPPGMAADRRERILASRAFSSQALRVLEAAGAKEGNDARGRLYTEMGRRFHGEGASSGAHPASVEVMAEAIAAAGLPPQLAEASDEERWDKPIRDNMDDVRREVGGDVGVPIVALRDGKRLWALSGPIMSEVPPRDRSLVLWDSVAVLITEPAVFELKRHRTAGPAPPAVDADGRVALPCSSTGER